MKKPKFVRAFSDSAYVYSTSGRRSSSFVVTLPPPPPPPLLPSPKEGSLAKTSSLYSGLRKLSPQRSQIVRSVPMAKDLFQVVIVIVVETENDKLQKQQKGKKNQKVHSNNSDSRL